MEGIDRAGRNDESSFSKRIRVRFEVTRFALPFSRQVYQFTTNEPTGSVHGWHDERSELCYVCTLSTLATSSDSLSMKSA